MKKKTDLFKSKYLLHSAEDMILRDHLAFDRTLFALERTILAYGRTSFILLTTGITMLKLFSEDRFFLVTGIVLIPLSIAIIVIGAVRFFIYRKRLKKIYHRN